MNALQKLTLALTFTAAVTAIAADQPVERTVSAKSLVQSHQRFVAMQVKYCLRNEPDLREGLALAHATYLQASESAALHLLQKHPATLSSRSVVVSVGTDPRAAAAQLRMIQSRGFGQCPELMVYMHGATAESLISGYERDYVNLLNAIQRKE